MKLKTEVEIGARRIVVEKGDKVLILGSCFASNIAAALEEIGCEVCLNPFGTLFNPFSIASSLRRLICANPFVNEECIQMGAGSELWCSFSHYTRFAKATAEEFLENTNEKLAEAAIFFSKADKIIITFGTAWTFRYMEDESHPMYGKIVSNCLKRPAKEFKREMATIESISSEWSELLSRPEMDGKKFIFTVSPIRHMADGAHGNTLSKSSLLIATDRIISQHYDRADYFPAYEILLDELRDYRWYAEDLVHPSEEAIEIIRKKFLGK